MEWRGGLWRVLGGSGGGADGPSALGRRPRAGLECSGIHRIASGGGEGKREGEGEREREREWRKGRRLWHSTTPAVCLGTDTGLTWDRCGMRYNETRYRQAAETLRQSTSC